MSSLNQVVNQT